MKLGFSFEWTCLYHSYLQNSLKPGNSIPGNLPSLTLNEHLPCTRSWGLWARQDYPWPNVHILVGKEIMQPLPLLITPIQNSKGKKKNVPMWKAKSSLDWWKEIPKLAVTNLFHVMSQVLGSCFNQKWAMTSTSGFGVNVLLVKWHPSHLPTTGFFTRGICWRFYSPLKMYSYPIYRA